MSHSAVLFPLSQISRVVCETTRCGVPGNDRMVLNGFGVESIKDQPAATLVNAAPGVCGSVAGSLSLSLTHSHTHTHTNSRVRGRTLASSTPR